jgi:site-specific DNA-methyltransferase (adenine-specific)
MIDLRLGDCLEILKTIPSESIKCMVTDPPYKTTKRGSYSGTGGFFKTADYNSGNGGISINEVKPEQYLPEIYRVMEESAHGYLMCSDKTLINFSLKLKEAGFHIIRNLVWVKNNCITGTFYMSNHEYIIFFRKGKGVKINNCGTKTALHFDNPKPKVHPNQKPIELIKVLIKNSSNENEIILDPFMGSGSTGVACKNTNRNFIGIEMDVNYHAVAVKRLSA